MHVRNIDLGRLDRNISIAYRSFDDDKPKWKGPFSTWSFMLNVSVLLFGQ